jgi:glutaredoxin
MTTATLLTKEDCAYCDHAKHVLGRIAADYPLTVETFSLDSPPGDTLARSVGAPFAPVVLIDGGLFSCGRLSERKLRLYLDRAVPAA